MHIRVKAGLLMLSGLVLFGLGALSLDRLISAGPAAGLSAEAMALRYAGSLGLVAVSGLLIQQGLRCLYRSEGR